MANVKVPDFWKGSCAVPTFIFAMSSHYIRTLPPPPPPPFFFFFFFCEGCWLVGWFFGWLLLVWNFCFCLFFDLVYSILCLFSFRELRSQQAPMSLVRVEAWSLLTVSWGSRLEMSPLLQCTQTAIHCFTSVTHSSHATLISYKHEAGLTSVQRCEGSSWGLISARNSATLNSWW